MGSRVGIAMNLTQPLHKACRERPAATATISGGRRQSWQQLAERVARLAGVLRAAGLQAGDRVGILGLNSARYLECLYATWWVGGVINPINTRWTAPEIAASLDDCATRLLLIDAEFRHLLEPIRSHSRCLDCVLDTGGEASAGAPAYEDLLAGAVPMADVWRGGSDLAALLYTGGTTGRPKGVMLSHDNLAINALAALAAAPRLSSPVALHVAPLFHVGGLSFLLQLASRLPCHVMMSSFEPAAALRLIEQERVTECFLVPTMIQRLLAAPDFERHDLSSLHTLIYGAAPIDPVLQGQLRQQLPAVGLVQAYGQTEAAPVVTILGAEHHEARGPYPGKVASAGRPIGITELCILGASGAEQPVGEAGEICVRGPTLMQGYWGQPELTAATLRDGWLHTGDVGHLDEDGFLYVVDRLKDMIITGGENVYSVEVEKVLLGHPAVGLCAVIGVPDDRWGERVHALVVRHPGLAVSANELLQHCRLQLAGYKCPRSVEFRSDLPLSAAGKLLKHLVRASFWQDRPRHIG